MPSYSFIEKLDRANEHLKKLRAELSRWVKSRPYGITDELDTKSGDNVLYARMLRPAPPIIATVVGDCLYNLRSSLDHLVYCLAARNQNRPLTDAEVTTCAFPICQRPQEFYKRGRGRIRLLATEPQTVIERLQPCRTGNPTAHPLWILEKLNNIDKHRRLLVTFLSPIGGGTRIPLGARLEFFKWSEQFGLTERKAIIARYRCIALDGARRVEMQFSPTLVVVFGDTPAEERVVEITLENISFFLSRRVFPRFRRFMR